MDKYQWTSTGMSIQPAENGPIRYVREVDYDALQAKIEELEADAERATYLEEELTSARIEIEDLTAAWKDSIDGVERIAFDMEPPNENTPRFITWVIKMRNKLNRIKARG